LNHNDEIRNMEWQIKWHGWNFVISMKLTTWTKKRDEFGDRNKIDHMDGIWTILLKSIKCMQLITLVILNTI
jgi:hypothetical protein